MVKIIQKIRLLFTYGYELEELLQENRLKRLKEERERKRYNLKLCLKHQQEENHSHYGENNCDYCKLLSKIKKEKRHEMV